MFSALLKKMYPNQYELYFKDKNMSDPQQPVTFVRDANSYIQNQQLGQATSQIQYVSQGPVSYTHLTLPTILLV